ncbi:tetratricopeptide repeat protein [Vibrio sonorensis]|uniref:tetratricopeptide repeat protein n=1 Tax=Vibrio sonorensis TaxID=1004316 RepID=UPI0008D99EE8|nr:tetratricopeptide repeat protein [Vibrio sonorensis]
MRTSLLLLFYLLSHIAFASTVDELLPKAENQDAQAQYELARLYQEQNSEQAKQDAIYWFIQAAEQAHPEATLALANIYIKGSHTPQDIPEAIYWLTEQSILGNIKAQIALGTLYENLPRTPSGIDMAEVWYRLAADKSDSAENDYSRILERQFNQQRAKQVASIDLLDDTLLDDNINIDPNQSPATKTQSKQNTTPLYAISGFGIFCLVIALYYAFSNRRWRKKYQVALSGNAALERKEEKIEQQATTIKQQKRQLETLFKQFKKMQSALAEKTQSSQQTKQSDNRLALACAVFGFSSSKIPEEKVIKARFKQLSKIYHPDMKGSEDEMKRLNHALKIILSHVNK